MFDTEDIIDHEDIITNIICDFKLPQGKRFKQQYALINNTLKLDSGQVLEANFAKNMWTYVIIGPHIKAYVNVGHITRFIL